MSDAIGLPTMLLRPTITQSAPAVVTPLACNMYNTPAGVHGANPSFSPMSSLPTFTGWKPSTSLSGRIRRTIASGLICFGSGICTRIP